MVSSAIISLKRAVTWNENGILDGARHITLGGYYAYVATPEALVIISLDDPLAPQLVKSIALDDVRASALQFRYLVVTHAGGVSVIDVTLPEQARLIPDNTIMLEDARGLHLARAYAYIAAGQGWSGYHRHGKSGEAEVFTSALPQAEH
jgi:hypothetical protein